MSDRTLSILYQDDFFVAINKPSGLLVHRSALDKGAQEFAVQLVRDQLGRHVYPVHRLDRPTSGVLLFAFDPQWVKKAQCGWHKAHKQYQALVRGWVNGAGFVDYPLRYEPDKVAEKQVRADKYQPAVSYYQTRQRFEVPKAVGRYQSARYSLLDLVLHSGRKHQLRRHMAHIRHPIVGDTTHGDGKQNAFMRTEFGLSSLALTCVQLRLKHPETNQELVISSPRSHHFNAALEHLSAYQI